MRRDDDELHLDLRRRRTHEHAPVLGGPVRSPAATLRPAAVMVKYMGAGRVHGFTESMQKDTHADHAVEGYSQYMQHDRAQLFTDEHRALDWDAFVET
jgi:hypothetical protein